MRKKTTEEFIAEARVIHGDKYSYSETLYVGAIDKVKIICPHHGVFEQIAQSHLGGANCKPCSHIGRNSHDTAKFITKAKKIHGSLYDYSNTEYTESRGKVSISCKIHGDFYQVANNHLNGQGCMECSLLNKTKTTEDYIKEVSAFHNNEYDYSKTVYKGAHEKILIQCKIHGEFSQTASNHRKGTRCPQCAIEGSGWTAEEWVKLSLRSKFFDSFKFYVVELFNEQERFMKFGITFNELSKRMKNIPYKYKVRCLIEGSAEDIFEMEELFKSEVDSINLRYKPDIYFGGEGECFAFSR